MLASLNAPKLLNTLRELNLRALQRGAEGRFQLTLIGDLALTQLLAERLSETPGRSGVHPWLRVVPSVTASANAVPFPAAPSSLAPNLVVAVTEHTGALAPQLEAYAVRERAPLLRVCVAAGAHAQVGTELPYPGEAARIVVPSLGLDTLLPKLSPALLHAFPSEHHLALARQLPALRPHVIRALIEETSRANALYAASSGAVGIIPALNLPVNLADTIILSKNQLLMAYKIALAAGKDGRARDILTEAVGVLGGGLLFRQIARGLVGLIPVWGIVPKVAVAYAGTWVIGQAAELWATQGRVPSAGELRPLYAQALERGRKLAGTLRPRRRTQNALPPSVTPPSVTGVPLAEESENDPDTSAKRGVEPSS